MHDVNQFLLIVRRVADADAEGRVDAACLLRQRHADVLRLQQRAGARAFPGLLLRCLAAHQPLQLVLQVGQGVAVQAVRRQVGHHLRTALLATCQVQLRVACVLQHLLRRLPRLALRTELVVVLSTQLYQRPLYAQGEPTPIPSTREGGLVRLSNRGARAGRAALLLRRRL